jgi:site-specific DNA-methyltransferase (adenine-specific)
MWFTDAHFIEAIELCKSWGFEYKTIAFVWEKRSKHNKLISNLGAWTLKNYELCLLATKGKMMKYKKINNIKQQVIAERTKHSRKPDIVRNNIEKLFGDIPRIELFARETAVGWDSWGNEV